MTIAFRLLIAIGVIVLLTVVPQGFASGQDNPGQGFPPSGDRPQDEAEQGALGEEAQEEKQFEGEIVSVDPDAETITIVGTEQMEMTFSWDDQTEVVGEPGGVQGLTGRSGDTILIHFREEAGQNLVTRIEIVEPGQEPGLESPGAPSPDQPGVGR